MNSTIKEYTKLSKINFEKNNKEFWNQFFERLKLMHDCFASIVLPNIRVTDNLRWKIDKIQVKECCELLADLVSVAKNNILNLNTILVHEKMYKDNYATTNEVLLKNAYDHYLQIDYELKMCIRHYTVLLKALKRYQTEGLVEFDLGSTS